MHTTKQHNTRVLIKLMRLCPYGRRIQSPIVQGSRVHVILLITLQSIGPYWLRDYDRGPFSLRNTIFANFANSEAFRKIKNCKAAVQKSGRA